MSKNYSEKPLDYSPQDHSREQSSHQKRGSKKVDDTDNTGFIKDWDPISPSTIKDSEERPDAKPTQTVHDTQSPTILIVEDDVDIGEFLQAFLEDETPYNIELVSDLPHALEKAQQLRPILYILDITLSGTSGLEVYDRLQTLEGISGVPVIMIGVSLPREEFKRRGIYQIKKPFDLTQFLAVITQAITRYEEGHQHN